MRYAKYDCISTLTGHTGDVYSVKFHPFSVSGNKKKILLHSKHFPLVFSFVFLGYILYIYIYI